MIDKYEAVGGIRIGRGNQILGGNLPQCHFVHHKSHMTCPGLFTVTAVRETESTHKEKWVKLQRKI
jgi:hypothetical protein